MLRTHRAFLSASVLTGVLLAGACGGSSSPKPAAAANTASTDTSRSSQSSQSSSSDSSSDVSAKGGSAKGGSLLPGGILDASYTRGQAHVEISGEAHASADLDTAGGLTGQGSTFITFRNASGSDSFTFTASEDKTQTGVAVSVGGITTGGEFDGKCHLELTQNDASGVAGTFTCTGVDAVTSTSAISNVDVRGSFSAQP